MKMADESGIGSTGGRFVIDFALGNRMSRWLSVAAVRSERDVKESKSRSGGCVTGPISY